MIRLVIQVQPDQHALGIGEVADDPPHRQREFLDDGGGGEGGGRLIAEGPPESIAQAEESHTGRFLKPLLPEVDSPLLRKRKRA